MAEQNPAIFLQAGAHPAEDVRRFIGGVSYDSVGVIEPDALAVTQNGTPNMSVNVASGRALIKGSEATYQGTYFVENRGTKNLSVNSSDPTNGRYDLVVAKVQDAAYSGATSAWSLAVVTGTPAASPLVPSAPANSIALAQILVPAASSSVTNANITDRRSRSFLYTGTAVCTSFTRPSGPYEGQTIYETDTDKVYVYNGSTWIPTAQLGAWTSYTPTITSTGTAPVMGGRTGRYQMIGKSVRGWARFKWTALGAGEGVGSGVYRFSLPVATSSQYGVFDTLGIAVAQDSGTRQYIGTTDWVTTTTVGIELEGGSQLAASGPFTPANNDFYMIHFDYEAA